MARTISDEDIRLNIIVNGNPAQKQLLDLEKSTRKLTKETAGLKIEKKKLEAQGKKNSTEWKSLTATIKTNTATINNNKATMKQLQNQIGITGLTMRQLKQKASQLRLTLNNMVPGSSDYIRYTKELGQIGARLTELKLKGRQTKISLSGIANGFNKYAALGASAIAATTGVVLGAQKMIDYNGKLSDSQSDVQKTTGLTKKEVDELTKSFGLLNTRTGRINLLKIAEEGGRIGIAKDEIQDFVRVMNKANVALGDSFQGGPEEVASKLGKLKLLFKETKNIGVEKAYEAIGSSINELGANGVATEANIASFATRIGSLPDALKPSIQDALGLGAAFEESGVMAEISGRAYSIFLGQAAKESSKFAKVMGISTEEVENLINTNPTEFFLQFSQRLAETKKTGTDTAKTMADLGLSADGVKKIIGAAGNNVGRFREMLDLSNKSMVESTSLTKEYNIKNNNLAANLDKVKKKLIGAFSSPLVIGGLTNLVTWFGKLIGAVKDVNVEYNLQSESTFQNAENSRRLANESENLLKKYQSLTKDGITPTKKEKKLLDRITLQLKDRLGQSVIAIDKETGSYKLNTEAVKEQIRLKRLTADQEAMTLVSRKKGAEERKKELEISQRDAEKEFKLRLEYFEETNATALKAYRESKAFSGAQKFELIERLDGYKELDIARKKAVKVNGSLNTQKERELDLMKKLNDLNFTQKDVDNFFKETTPKEGAEKFIGNTKFIFKNGNWEAVPIKTTKPLGDDEDLTPEDQSVKSSKEQLAEFIEEWHNNQELQRILREEEGVAAQEAEDIAKLEMKYLKMAEEAGFENAFVAGLEEIKNQEIQEVKDKWAEKRLKAKQVEDEKYAKLDAAQKQKLIKADADLAQAKINARNQGLTALQSIFGRENAIAKLAFGFQKALAIQEILINNKKANAQITSNLAIANMKALAFNPLFGGMPYTALNIAAATKHTLANNINAGAQIAGIVGTAIAGFEGGLYNKDSFPVQRSQDGKMFNAQFGGNTPSGVVSKPTVFMAGENGPELIVDSKAFKEVNPDIRNSFMREISRVKGFELGLYKPQSFTNETANTNTSETDISTPESNLVTLQMIDALNRASSIFEKVDREGVYMSDDLRNGKRIKEVVSDYEDLVNENKR